MSQNPYAAPSTSVADFDSSAALVRPRVTTTGIGLFWLMLAVGAVSGIFSVFTEEFPQDLPRGPIIGLTLVVLAAVYAIVFWILAAAGKGRNWGRITLTVLTALSVVVTVLVGPAKLVPDLAQRVLYLAQLAVEVVGVVLLFLPASNAWFAAKRAA